MGFIFPLCVHVYDCVCIHVGIGISRDECAKTEVNIKCFICFRSHISREGVALNFGSLIQLD